MVTDIQAEKVKRMAMHWGGQFCQLQQKTRNNWITINHSVSFMYFLSSFSHSSKDVLGKVCSRLQELLLILLQENLLILPGKIILSCRRGCNEVMEVLLTESHGGCISVLWFVCAYWHKALCCWPQSKKDREKSSWAGLGAVAKQNSHFTALIFTKRNSRLGIVLLT